ncbi:MAG: hypothetical protein ACE5D3_07515 [Candidatus Binatia bacterium]
MDDDLGLRSSESPASRDVVEEMAVLDGGRALLQLPRQLACFVLVDYVAGRRKIV